MDLILEVTEVSLAIGTSVLRSWLSGEEYYNLQIILETILSSAIGYQDVQQSATTMASIQGRREIQHCPTFPTMSDTRNSSKDHSPKKHFRLVEKSPIGDLQEVQQSTTLASIQGYREIQHRPSFLTMLDVQQYRTSTLIQGCRETQYRPTFSTMLDTSSSSDHIPLRHVQLVENSPINELQGLMQHYPSFNSMLDIEGSPRNTSLSEHIRPVENSLFSDLKGNYKTSGGASSSTMRSTPWKGEHMTLN